MALIDWSDVDAEIERRGLTERSLCTSPTTGRTKRRYTRREVLDASVRLTRALGEETQPYHCERCAAWHVGHTVPLALRLAE